MKSKTITVEGFVGKNQKVEDIFSWEQRLASDEENVVLLSFAKDIHRFKSHAFRNLGPGNMPVQRLKITFEVVPCGD